MAEELLQSLIYYSDYGLGYSKRRQILHSFNYNINLFIFWNKIFSGIMSLTGKNHELHTPLLHV